MFDLIKKQLLYVLKYAFQQALFDLGLTKTYICDFEVPVEMHERELSRDFSAWQISRFKCLKPEIEQWFERKGIPYHVEGLGWAPKFVFSSQEHLNKFLTMYEIFKRQYQPALGSMVAISQWLIDNNISVMWEEEQVNELMVKTKFRMFDPQDAVLLALVFDVGKEVTHIPFWKPMLDQNISTTFPVSVA